MAKILAFTNQKGGVGKTTCSINLASCLAEMGQKVLVIDFDPQQNATSGLGVDASNHKGCYELLTKDDDFNNSQLIMPTQIKNLDVLPSSMNLAGAEIELINKFGRESILKNKIVQVRDKYDFIIIDCPPSLGNLTVNALTASDGIIIPMQCEYFALEGLSQLIFTINSLKKMVNPKIEIEGLIITMFDKRSNLTMQVLDEIKKCFGDKLYKTVIPRNIRLAEAPSFGQPIIVYDKDCKGAVAYRQLANEFMKRQRSDK